MLNICADMRLTFDKKNYFFDKHVKMNRKVRIPGI